MLFFYAKLILFPERIVLVKAIQKQKELMKLIKTILDYSHKVHTRYNIMS